MGNVMENFQQADTTCGDANKKTQSSDFKKNLSCFIDIGPKSPINMPNLGDGRSQDELRTTAEIMYDMDTKQNVNIAFLGASNEAKTAFINSLRFVQDARPDCCVQSSKSSALQYLHCDPKYKHVRFWDLGDVSKDSFIDRCLYAFDAIVLVTTELLRDSDIDLIKQGCQIQPPIDILIVRTGMDAYITTTFSSDFTKEQMKEGKETQGKIIREMFEQRMFQQGVNCPDKKKTIYLVSAQGMLAARAVNMDGLKYIWDEYNFMMGILESIGKRRYGLEGDW